MSTFYGKRIITIEWQGKQVYPEPNVGDALDYCPGSLAASIRTDWKDEIFEGEHYIIATGEDAKVIARLAGWPPNKHKRIILLTLPGVFLVCLKTTKPKGKALRRFLSGETLPEMYQAGKLPDFANPLPPPIETGIKEGIAVPAVPLSPAQQFLAMAQMAVDMEKRQSDFDRRLTALEQAKVAPAAAPPQAPPASVTPIVSIPAPTTRKRLNRHMRDAVLAVLSRYDQGFSFEVRSRWHQLYRGLYDRCGIDLEVRARNMRVRPLDAAERIDVPARNGQPACKVIDLLYSLAVDMWPLGAAA